MTLEVGVVYPNIDVDRDAAQKVKLQYHRAGLTFMCEGIGLLLNKDGTPARGTDYTPRNWATNLSQEESSGQDELHVDSVKGLAVFQQVTIDRDGDDEESHYITDIDVENKILTLDANLTNAQSDNATVDADQIEVYKSSTATVIDCWITGQNVTDAVAGADFQAGIARIDDSIKWANGDDVHAEIRVPYAVKTFHAAGSTVLAKIMCNHVALVKGDLPMRADSEESATALDPDYILRITFTPGEETPTEKNAAFKLETWRA